MNATSLNRHIIQTGKTILEQEARAIQQIAERLDTSFSDAVMLLASCKGKIIISGMGKSGIIAQKIAATMASTGSTALFLHPADFNTNIIDLELKTDYLFLSLALKSKSFSSLVRLL